MKILLMVAAVPLAIAGAVLVWLHAFDTLGADEDETWDSLDARTLTRDSVGVVLLANVPGEGGTDDRGGTVAFIDRRGHLTTVGTGATDNGSIAMDRDGSTAWSSATRFQLIRGGTAVRSSHPRYPGPASAAFVGGRIMHVVNGTAYVGANGRTWSKAGVAGDEFGLDGDAVLSLRWRRDVDARQTLVRTHLDGSRADIVATWRTQGYPALRRSRVSDLYAVDGRVWFLEDMRLTERRQREVGHGIASYLRLASVDLATGRYRTTTLRSWPGTDRAWPNQRGWRSLPADSIPAHLHDGRLWFLDAQGSICGVELSSSKLTCAEGAVRDVNEDGEVSWSGGRLTVLTIGTKAAMTTYDIVTGQRIARLPVPELKQFLGDHPYRVVNDFAARPPGDAK